MKTATILFGLVSAAFSMPALREELNALMIMADPTECIKEHCPNEWTACLNDSKCVPALQSCEDQCGTKQSCWQLCLAKKGNSNAVNVAKCAAANNCLGEPAPEMKKPKHHEEMSSALVLNDDPTQCLKDKCPSQYDSCVADSKCLPAI